MERYLDAVEPADGQEEVVIDPSAVAEALEKQKRHREPEAHFIRVGHGHAPAYNVQTGVDAEPVLIVSRRSPERQPITAVCCRRPRLQKRHSAVRPRCMLSPTPATPTTNRPKLARQKVFWRMCLPIAPPTTKGRKALRLNRVPLR